MKPSNLTDEIDEALRLVINDSDRQTFQAKVGVIRAEVQKELQRQQQAYYQEYLKRKKHFVHQRDELIRFKSNPQAKDFEKQASRVLREVHSKQKWNQEFMDKFEFGFQHPQPEGGGRPTQQQTILLLQAEIDSLKEIFSFPGLFRNSAERADLLKKVQQNSMAYRKRLEQIRKPSLKAPSEVILEGTIQSICSELLRFRTVESMSLTVKQKEINAVLSKGKGILATQQVNSRQLRISIEHFEQLMECILLSLGLQKLDLRFMDNEFDEPKCELIKRKLARLRGLDSLRLQNYYSECKMGVFVDFDWRPHRKLIHIFSGKW